MSRTLRVACVQLTSRADKAANLEKTERLVARAAATGADVVVLPEKWNAIGDREELHAALAALRDRPADERDPVAPRPIAHRRDGLARLERLRGRV